MNTFHLQTRTSKRSYAKATVDFSFEKLESLVTFPTPEIPSTARLLRSLKETAF